MRTPVIEFSHPTPFDAPWEAAEVAELITSVLANVPTGAGGSLFDRVALEALSGGRSGAYVFKVSALSPSGRTRGAASAVIKIAPLDAGISEKINYERFVRPLLPALHRPDLLGFATRQGRAGLCYSFLGNGDAPETLTSRLSVGDLAALDLVFSSLVQGLRECWYHAGKVRRERDLAAYYLERYFGDRAFARLAEATLISHAAEYFGNQRTVNGYWNGETVFPCISDTLFVAPSARNYKSCIIHGDLNSDNVILDRQAIAAQLIDFRRAGRGHALQDLVTLEASVRINYPSDAPLVDISEIERRIAYGETSVRAPAYSKAIRMIRETAHRYFGFEETAANYHFAVAAVGLRLMKATDLSAAARARIVTSALWAAKALSGK